jgi:hypothetical protein
MIQKVYLVSHNRITHQINESYQSNAAFTIVGFLVFPKAQDIDRH